MDYRTLIGGQLLIAILFIFSNDAYAQSRDKQVRTQVDSVLAARYYKTSYDTNYVVRPKGSLKLKLTLNQSGDDFHVKGDKDQG